MTALGSAGNCIRSKNSLEMN